MANSINKFNTSVGFLVRVLYVVLMFFTFYAYYLFEDDVLRDELTRVSRISVILLSTFMVVIIILIKAYGGYDIGGKRTRETVLSMCLSVTLTDIITYIQLCVMYKKVVSILLLIMAVCTQYLITALMTKTANVVHFACNPPQTLLIIYGDESKKDMVCHKLKRYQNRFRIKKIMRYDEAEMHRSIRANSAVMLVDVPPERQEYIIGYCYKREKKVYYLPNLADILINNAHHELIDDISFFRNEHRNLTVEQRFVKRVFDIIVSLTGIIISAPIMLIEAIAVKCEDGGKILYRQERETINGKKFKVWKFRTMIENAEKGNQAVLASENDPRITKVGAFLRKTRLDELPQLFNVLAGYMSIVGPRPERESIAQEYYKDLPEFQYRLRVKAGLTGLAQIVGKYNTTPKDKLVLDLIYIENYSLRFDFKIVLQTLTVFLLPEKSEGFANNDKVVFIDDSAIDMLNYRRDREEHSKIDE